MGQICCGCCGHGRRYRQKQKQQRIQRSHYNNAPAPPVSLLPPLEPPLQPLQLQASGEPTRQTGQTAPPLAYLEPLPMGALELLSFQQSERNEGNEGNEDDEDGDRIRSTWGHRRFKKQKRIRKLQKLGSRDCGGGGDSGRAAAIFAMATAQTSGQREVSAAVREWREERERRERGEAGARVAAAAAPTSTSLSAADPSRRFPHNVVYDESHGGELQIVAPIPRRPVSFQLTEDFTPKSSEEAKGSEAQDSEKMQDGQPEGRMQQRIERPAATGNSSCRCSLSRNSSTYYDARSTPSPPSPPPLPNSVLPAGMAGGDSATSPVPPTELAELRARDDGSHTPRLSQNAAAVVSWRLSSLPEMSCSNKNDDFNIF